MKLATGHHKNIKAFVIVSGAVYPVRHIPSETRLFTIPIIGRGLATIVGFTLTKEVKKNAVNEAFFPNTQVIPDGFTQIRSKIWLQAKVIITIANELLHLYQDFESLTPEYDRVTQPVYIIHGAMDRLIPVTQAIELHDALPNSELLLLEHIGHQAQFARPDLIVDAIMKMELK